MSVKVCHVTSVHPRYDTRIFIKECTSLANVGYDVTLLVADGKTDEIKNGVKIISVTGIPKSRFQRIIKSSNIMYKKALEVDAEIYHLHDPELLPLARKLEKAGKKVIFDSHENYPAQIKVKGYIPYILRSVISGIYKTYETGTAKKIDAVITPCTFFDGVDIFKGRCKKTEIISNAPLLSEFYDKYQDTDKGNIVPSVCHVGGLTYSRGITHLIKAAYKANVKLILVGKFSPPTYEVEVKKMLEYSCVEYRGHLTRDQVLKVYQESTIGAATILNIGQYNTGDNFATKVYEYMSMGLPVILTKYSYSEKMIQKYDFGIAVTPDNVDEIADAIMCLIDNPDKAKEMGENGRRAVLEEFNWDIEEKKLLALYHKLAIN
jgi:glycosyltransferase involved in cell wall biosynthesis